MSAPLVTASWVSLIVSKPTFTQQQVTDTLFLFIGFTWRPEPPPLEQAIAALKTALNNGMTLWNGAEFYGPPEYNSMTLLKAYFTKYPEDADKVTLIIKGGVDLATLKPNGSPESVRRSLDNIISQLGGTKKLDLFSCSRRDPKTPLDVTFGVIQKEYIDTGKLGAIALSECSADTINEAAKIAKIGTVEVELSIFTPDILTNGVAAACAQHGIPITAYSPIGRGVSQIPTYIHSNACISLFSVANAKKKIDRSSPVDSRRSQTSSNSATSPPSRAFKKPRSSTI